MTQLYLSKFLIHSPQRAKPYPVFLVLKLIEPEPEHAHVRQLIFGKGAKATR